MSKVVRSVFVRLCGALGVHGLRRRVRLPLSITLSETVWPGRTSQSCAGQTRDISGTGLSFVLPTTRIGDRHIFNEGRASLSIRLDLPGGPVDMCAAHDGQKAASGIGDGQPRGQRPPGRSLRQRIQ